MRAYVPKSMSDMQYHVVVIEMGVEVGLKDMQLHVYGILAPLITGAT